MRLYTESGDHVEIMVRVLIAAAERTLILETMKAVWCEGVDAWDLWEACGHAILSGRNLIMSRR